MSFSRILSRGTRAANRTPKALVLYIVVLGLFQGLSTVAGGLMPIEALQMQPGQAPSPQLFWLIGFGCFSCVWGLVMIFVTPWITAGAVGQMRDRLTRPDGSAAAFAEHASRYYRRMLIIGIIWLLIFVVLWAILAGVGLAIVSAQGGDVNPQKIDELNTHPANIASGIVLLLLLSALGVWFAVAQAVVVADDQTALSSLSRACRFCTGHTAEAFKLFLLFLVLGAGMVLITQLPALLGAKNLGVLALAGLLLALYFPYIILLELGWATSLYLARIPERTGTT